MLESGSISGSVPGFSLKGRIQIRLFPQRLNPDPVFFIEGRIRFFLEGRNRVKPTRILNVTMMVSCFSEDVAVAMGTLYLQDFFSIKFHCYLIK